VPVPGKLKGRTRSSKCLTFKKLMSDLTKRSWDDNAIPTLRQADKVIFFHETEQKTPLDIERDRAV
jgi:hypothetical protein